MYFNRYTPATKSQNLETARAQMIYNAVSRFSSKAEPRAKDYVAYCREKLNTYEICTFLLEPDEYAMWEMSKKAEWCELVELVHNQGQPLRNQHVVYFAIIDSGVKCGEAKDLVQRYSNINRTTPVQKMWYMEVESKEQAQAAEHALHTIFDHARCMNRQQNKKDYYECDAECAQKFMTANAHKIHKAIMEAIEGIE
jgi:hypothetical protein